MKEKILCFLSNKFDYKFIAVVDIANGVVSIRESDNSPFGLPISDIEENTLFVITYKYGPGSMNILVSPATVSDYIDVTSNKSLVKSLFDGIKASKPYSSFPDPIGNNINQFESYLQNKLSSMRDNKIDSIIGK